MDENATDDQVIAIQPKPRIFYQRVNYLELYDDHVFLNRFRLSKITFTTTLRFIENKISTPSTQNTEILAPCKLYMTLRYFATGSISLSIADFAGVSESAACQYFHQVCTALVCEWQNIILFPTNDFDVKKVVDGFYNRSKFPGVIGALGCTHIKIQSPGGNNAESYRNQKGFFSINAQFVCDPWLKIIDLEPQWPGAMDDDMIFHNSTLKSKFETGILKGYLLGDDGYEIKPYLMTPLLGPTTRSQQIYNESLVTARNVIERCFGALKRRFPILSKGITVNLFDTPALIAACAVLHNICVDMHDDLPNDDPIESNVNNEDREDLFVNVHEPMLSGRQERNRLIRNHFANLQ